MKSAFKGAFLISILANGLFVICQMAFAYIANSTSLFADGVHNLGDVFSLIVAWIGNEFLTRPSTDRSTYGKKKVSILAALINVILLIFSCGIIATEAFYKLFHPSPVEVGFVMVVASVGILVNGVTALLFIRGQHDLNIRAAFLHLWYDALVSLGVVVSAALIYWTGWNWIDPVTGLLIAGVILKTTWSLFADGFHLLLDGVPREVSVAGVRKLLNSWPGVEEVHDLHIWALSTRENALSVHLWMPKKRLTDKARQGLEELLRTEHQIHHTTIQIERTQGDCECPSSRHRSSLSIRRLKSRCF